jgi:2Fe-2S ferredoxin
MIQVEPSGAAFDIQANETIIQAAWRNGYTWPTICNGRGTCKTCVFLTLDGEPNLSVVEAWEQEGLQSIADSLPNAGRDWRLACQATVHGNVRLRKIGVRKQDGND